MVKKQALCIAEKTTSQRIGAKLSIPKKIEELYKTNQYGFKHQDPEAVADPELVEFYKKKYNINTDLHRSCINCQIRQISKYEKTALREGKDAPEFSVKCKGIPRGLPPGSLSKVKEVALKSDIPLERAKKLMLSTIDPVAWAELMFGFSDEDKNWHLRAYQKEQLRCTALRNVCREGRRSGKTFIMALKLIYYAFNLRVTKGRDASGKEIISGPEVMVITPYQAQLTNIFNEIESLLKRNVELRDQVTTGTADSLYIKTPMFKMELKNGAGIRGFVSGLGVKGDGSGGGTIRGQNADVIYLDEMDMIPEDILDKVITPILLTKPEVHMIATSTPIGKRGKFYSWCLERPDFKEDYYPSTVLPHWDNIANELISESTKEGFAAEYMADFIEGEYGVFKPSLVHAARADFSYQDTKNAGVLYKELAIPRDRKNMIICMGIDWNKNAGTEFFVVGYSTTAMKWVALDATNVSSSEYSAKRWMQEVIRLNNKWKPNYIYADEGYGHTIIEDLLLHAHRLKAKPNKTTVDKQTAQLTDRLISFNFSSTIELKDPIDGGTLKKAGKHFLVENALKILEDGTFFYPQGDETLTKQLLNYVILRKSPTTGKPVYGPENDRIGDHRLDAMMLALGGLTLEVSVYSGKRIPLSRPGLVERQSDNNDYISPHEESDHVLREMKKRGFPGAIEVLKIMRGQGSLEEDEAIKEKYKKEGLWPRSDQPKKRRGNIRGTSDEKPSIMNSIRNQRNEFKPVSEVSKPHKTSRRKGRGRGWKKIRR